MLLILSRLLSVTGPLRFYPSSVFVKDIMYALIRFFLPVMMLCSANSTMAEPAQETFTWPDDKTWALSLSFDDARLSQLNMGVPLFNKTGVRATFYVLPGPLEQHLADWKAVLDDGHEIGNHTVNHPCTGNFDWVTEEKNMKNYSLDRMRNELNEANRRIGELLGIRPESFAYTCGETAVGAGPESESYIPLIAELFSSGRGWLDEAVNKPLKINLAHVLGMKMDDTTFDSLKPVLDMARSKGYWVVLVGHEIAEIGEQQTGNYAYTTSLELLEELIRYVKDPANRAWLAPVRDVAEYIGQQRKYPGGVTQ